MRRLSILLMVSTTLLGLLLAFPAAAAGALPLALRVAPAEARLRPGGPGPAAYPYPPRATPGLDAYGFVTGQCTSFVAWWLNSHGLPFGVLTVGPKGTGRFLNASSWADSARTAGFQVGSRPAVGAVAQWNAHESSVRFADDGSWRTLTAGGPGHVAVVTRVLPDGQAEWIEYGWGGHSRLHLGRGHAPRYLYLGVDPPPPVFAGWS